MKKFREGHTGAGTAFSEGEEHERAPRAEDLPFKKSGKGTHKPRVPAQAFWLDLADES